MVSRYEARSACVGRAGSVICIAWPRATPFVLGVQASTSATSASFTGEVMCAVNRSFAHPGEPKSHGSRWAFLSPQDVICCTAHSPAALRFGEPVSRGP